MNPSTATSADDGELTDIIGARVLTGTQMVWISRLSTHPLPMIASGFVTVAGQGPSDSNGAGKSSFIAAISLLSGDEQWRWGSGAKAASELLFTAEVAAQAQHSNAAHGYVIGVYTDPSAVTFEELHESAITVWLRINRGAPYIDLRWSQGLHFAMGATEAARANSVDEIWSRLKRRGTSGDLHAGSFNRTMYGSYVRSVSFLSTSVRASHTPNLLAQPLNELSPDRIFDAVSALTGLDRKLEHERESRTVEHARRERQREVEEQIQRWEAETRRIEEAIAERERARGVLEQVRHLWKGQCARAVVDSHERLQGLRADVLRLRGVHEELAGKLGQAEADLEALEDDDAFGKRARAASAAWEKTQRRKAALEAKSEQLVAEAEQLQGKRQDLGEQARNNDGRTVAQAAGELEEANDALGDARVKAGIAEERRSQARQRLDAAEQGKARGAAALERLGPAGIAAAPLLDVLHVPEDDRSEWEPRLAPFDEAVVVADADFDRATTLLMDLPGAVLIAADPPGSASLVSGLPETLEAKFHVGGLLAGLQDRADAAGRFTDAGTRVKILGEFPEAITGRTARIRQARNELEAAVAHCKAEAQAVAAAEAQVRLAKRRLGGAEAAQQVADLGQKITETREANDAITLTIESEQPAWAEVEEEHRTVMLLSAQREARIAQYNREIATVNQDIDNNLAQRLGLDTQIAAIDMDSLLESFEARDPEDAARHLAVLTEPERTWSLADWIDETLGALEKALILCFPTGTTETAVPETVRTWWNPADSRITRRSPAASATGELISGLSTHLRAHESQDEFEQQRINQQRAEYTGNLEAAQDGFAEASAAAQAFRSGLAATIRATINQVEKHFNTLDRAYGGYGASIDCNEPEAPTEPDKPWRWTLTPKWARAEGQRPAPYRLKGNTAQVEEKAIKLVCAAALAGSEDRPLMLILDELGSNLGKQHRRDAVALFEAIGKDRNITVIGALQDEMERYAIEASGLFIKLRRSSDTQPYNDPPAVVGHEAQAARVLLLQDWLETGHLAAGRPGEADRSR